MFLRILKKAPAAPIVRAFHYQPGVAPSPDQLSNVFRVDSIMYDTLKPKFSLFELCFMFRVAKKRQHPVTAENVVTHQISTELIGTTSSKDTAHQLAKVWPERNTILTIDTSFLRSLLIDVERTVMIARGSLEFFQSKYLEKEHALTALPIYAVRSLELLHTPKHEVMMNPLYMQPSSSNIAQVNETLSQQMSLVEKLFTSGKKMTSNEIQTLHNCVFELLDQLFQKNIGDNNPFRMTVEQYQQCYGTDCSMQQLQSYTQSTLMIDVLTNDGHSLFMQNPRYSQLIKFGDLAMTRRIEEINQEHGYGYGSTSE
jgi:hypothetical protein